MKPHQPELMDNFGVYFYGAAYTATGDIWWYNSWDNKGVRRDPLLPVSVKFENKSVEVENTP